MNTCRLSGHFEHLFPAAPASFWCCKQQTMQTSAEETSLLQKHHVRSRDKVQQRSGGQWCYIKLLNLPVKQIHSPNSLIAADGTGLNTFSPTECETCSTLESCLFSFICIIFSPLFPFFVRLPAVFSFSNARSPLSRSVLFSLPRPLCPNISGVVVR